MNWSEVLLVLLVSHAVGDVLFQTEWQARAKVHGFPDPQGRRALAGHVATYLSAFIPALILIALETGAPRAVAVAAVVAITHFLIDDGWLVGAWLGKVKHSDNPTVALSIAVDQSFHVLCLLGAAVVAAN